MSNEIKQLNQLRDESFESQAGFETNVIATKESQIDRSLKKAMYDRAWNQGVNRSRNKLIDLMIEFVSEQEEWSAIDLVDKLEKSRPKTRNRKSKEQILEETKKKLAGLELTEEEIANLV